ITLSHDAEPSHLAERHGPSGRHAAANQFLRFVPFAARSAGTHQLHERPQPASRAVVFQEELTVRQIDAPDRAMRGVLDDLAAARVEHSGPWWIATELFAPGISHVPLNGIAGDFRLSSCARIRAHRKHPCSPDRWS